MGSGQCSVYLLSISVQMIQRIVPLGRYGDVVVKLGQNIRQFNMVKISNYHKKMPPGVYPGAHIGVHGKRYRKSHRRTKRPNPH